MNEQDASVVRTLLLAGTGFTVKMGDVEDVTAEQIQEVAAANIVSIHGDEVTVHRDSFSGDRQAF